MIIIKTRCGKKLSFVSSIDQSINQLVGHSVHQHIDFELPCVVVEFENNPSMQLVVS